MGSAVNGARFSVQQLFFFSAATASLPALGQDEKYYQHADGHAFSLSGENIMNYHGARAYFDGEYFKQGELEAKAQ